MAAKEQGDLFLRKMAELTTKEQGQVLELVEKYQRRNSTRTTITIAGVCLAVWAALAIHKDNLLE